MIIRENLSILSSEITDKGIFVNRRKLIKAAAGISIASLLPAAASPGYNYINYVYIAGVSAVIHYLWLVKSDYSEPVFYACIMFILLSLRLFAYLKTRKATTIFVKHSSTT